MILVYKISVLSSNIAHRLLKGSGSKGLRSLPLNGEAFQVILPATNCCNKLVIGSPTTIVDGRVNGVNEILDIAGKFRLSRILCRVNLVQ